MTLLARRTLLPLSLAFGLALPMASATALDPGHAEPSIAAAFAETLQQGHYSHKKINDDLSEQWFDSYLDSLDYGRIYLMQSDIDELMVYRDSLDDDLRAGTPSLEFAYAAFDRFLQRVEERVAFAATVIEAHDFSFDDPTATVDLDRHEDPWASSQAQIDEIWRTRIAEQLLRMHLAESFADDDDAPPLQLGSRDPKVRLLKRYERVLHDQQSLKPLDVLEVYLGALSHLYDPHSVWFKPMTKENFDIQMADTLIGIGAVLQSEEGYTVIKELVPGGPANATGQLHAGDRIIAVAQGDDEPVDVVEMRLDNVVKLIRGRKDTTVVLTVLPADATDPSHVTEVSIVRDKVKLSRAAARDEVIDVLGTTVGVINVPSFYVDAEAKAKGDPNYGSTTTDVAAILSTYPEKNVDVIVIDLRFNGGGSLDEAITMTGLFLPGGPVVQTRDSFGRVEVYKDSDKTTAWDGPVVVLTSEQSASASEIFAGAIQDYGRGLIVGGVSTHGKGSVQHLMGMERVLLRQGDAEAAAMAGAIKYTSHMFFRVNGESTQIKGVVSDVVIPSPYAGLEFRESDLEHPLPWDAIKPTVRPKAIPVDKAALQAASDARVRQSMEFAFLEEDVNERNRAQAEDTLSLHEATRRAEIERRKKIGEARESARRDVATRGSPIVHDPKFLNPSGDAADDKDDKVQIPDAILDEAILIARDYVKQLG